MKVLLSYVQHSFSLYLLENTYASNSQFVLCLLLQNMELGQYHYSYFIDELTHGEITGQGHMRTEELKNSNHKFQNMNTAPSICAGSWIRQPLRFLLTLYILNSRDEGCSIIVFGAWMPWQNPEPSFMPQLPH